MLSNCKAAKLQGESGETQPNCARMIPVRGVCASCRETIASCRETIGFLLGEHLHLANRERWNSRKGKVPVGRTRVLFGRLVPIQWPQPASPNLAFLDFTASSAFPLPTQVSSSAISYGHCNLSLLSAVHSEVVMSSTISAALDF